VQPLLYDYNEYGERVGMRTFQTTPEGDPSHVEDTGAKTAWHFHEATGSLLRKEYADGKGPEYAYNEAGQLAERRWAREGAVSRLAVSGLAGSGLAGSGLAGSGLAGSGLAVSGLAVSGLAVSGLAGSGLASEQDLNPGASVTGKPNSKTANGSERTFKIATSYSYDPATLQLATSTATDGTAVHYEYDADGRLAKVTDATGTREFAYDLRGQVTKETVVLQHDPAGDPAKAAPIHYEIRRTYTKLGQPESVHLVSADGQSLALDHQIGYSWNEHSQLASVKSLAGDFAYGYDAKSPALLTKMTGPVHEVETSYEPHRNLITGVVNRTKSSIGILPMARAGTPDSPPAAPSLTNVPASPNTAPAADSDPGTKNEEPSTLSSYTYANDLLGRRETISQGGEGFGMLKLGQNKVEVAYNDRSEVTGAVYRSNTETRQNFEYSYDAIGNRERTVSEIDSKRSELSYETNALNQYKKISANQRQLAVPYDLDGNLLEDTRNTYTWNADNNLIRVDAKDGTSRIDYVYDHQSRRTVRVETTNPGTKNEAQKTTYYLYDDWNLVANVSAVTGHRSGVTGEEADSVRYYTWGRDLSGSLQGAGGVGGLLAISTVHPPEATENWNLKTENFKTLYPTYDANGNIGQLINADANVVAAYAYDPFGNVTEMAGAEAAENPWRFSTKPVEAGTGWLYYGFRYYNPETGRWASRDPIMESGGENLYGFVWNNGVGETDYLGFASLGNPPDELLGLNLVAHGMSAFMSYYGIWVKKHQRAQWSVDPSAKGVWAGTDGDTNEKRESLLTHELVALWFQRQGTAESSYLNSVWPLVKPFPTRASGTHNIAMAAELARLAELDSTQCICAYVKERFGKAHGPSHTPGQSVFYYDKLKGLVDFICNCEDGNEEGNTYSDDYERKRRRTSFDDEAIRIKYVLRCNNKAVSGNTSFSFYD